ncbi:uncharacterized protein LOC120187732 [Hibiscus syriacus]|uniref:uncharacterized protein LOC120187732 n=1 Tax=Hibiscus syriacus TaxID=106335 RepID=UPI0019231785|nr:uncharacterized protein LOC120187732 [Hibiscus syriacus]
MIYTKAHLRLDVPTRWNSTYMMLNVAEKYEHSFDSFARDDNSFFLNHIVGDGVPTFDDWENVRRIAKILEPFYDLTLKNYDRSRRSITYSNKSVIVYGLASIKGEFIRATIFVEEATIWLEQKYELDKFLAEEEDENNLSSFDLLLWWKVNSPRYPILAQMARDVFSVPISTVAPESAFSTSGHVLDCFRSSLTSTMVEALICTQDWLRKSKDHINLDEYVLELQEMEDGNI